MSVYVDFLKIDALQITTSKNKTFRDLEQEFLKKFKDRAIIGFFEYTPYPFELKVVTIKDKLDPGYKYLIITDKTKFTNEDFKTTFQTVTRNAFLANKKHNDNRDKYTFLKKNKLQKDEYILPNPFNIKFFDMRNSNQ